MRKTLTLLLALMTLSLSAETTLKGRLVDETTGQAIAGATITLANQNITTTTNQNGEFVLRYLEAGDEEVIIEADGYNAGIELVQLEADKATELASLSLQPDLAREVKDEAGPER